jgi:hypothetical protein
MEGYLGTVAYQMETAGKYLPQKPQEIAPGMTGYIAYPLLKLVRKASWQLAKVFYLLDAKQKYTGAGYPKNYILIVEKALPT